MDLCVGLSPVALWSKNWIIGRWIALVFLVFFLLLVDMHCFHLLREYNTEDTVSGFVHNGAWKSGWVWFSRYASSRADSRCKECRKFADFAMQGYKTADAYGTGKTAKLVDRSSDQRLVAVWSKNWIIGRWISLVFLVSFLLVVDVLCFHLLRKYNPEDTVYGLFIMGLGSLVGFGFLGSQAQELIQDAKTVNDVPSWCYGLASSRAN
ncbi:hypothetical protein ACET3Z_030636 [Daucus carota]